jgi:hypothetical protein
MDQACITGDLDQLKHAVSDGAIDYMTILTLTFTACTHNHQHIVYWLVATYPLAFDLTIISGMLMYYKCNKNGCFDLIVGLLPATYNCILITSCMDLLVEFGWHSFRTTMVRCLSDNNIQLLLESEYLI